MGVVFQIVCILPPATRRWPGPWPVVLALAALLPAPALPAQAPDSLALAAVLRAVDHASPAIAGARAATVAATARIAPASRPPDPQLQLGWMNYALPDGRPMPPLAMRQLQVMQMIPTAGKLGAQADEARARAAQASHTAEAVRWTTRRQAATQFFELLRLDRALGVMHDSRRAMADLRRAAVAMYEVGEGRQADVLRADVELARMDADVARMESMRTGAEAELRALLDLPPDTVLGAPAAVRLPADPPPLDALRGTTLAARPEMQESEAALAAAAHAARRARAEAWPDLVVGAQLGANRSLDGMRETMGSLMLGASLPVFARDRQHRMRQEAGAMETMARADLRMRRAETLGELTMVHATLVRTAQLQRMYDDRLLPAAEAAVIAARAAYRAGTLPFMAVLEDQLALDRHRLDRLALDSEAGTAWAALEALTGRSWLPDRSSPGGDHD